MAIHTVYTLSKDDPEARNWLAFFRRHGHSALSNLVIERVYWLEGAIDVEGLLPPCGVTASTFNRIAMAFRV